MKMGNKVLFFGKCMKKLFLFSWVIFLSLGACPDREEIQQYIQNCHQGSIEVSQKVSYALDLFENQEFEKAATHFNHVLINDYHLASKIDLGTAIWGSLLCAAILDDSQVFEERFSQAYAFFIDPQDERMVANALSSQELIILASNNTWKSRPGNEKKPDPEVKFANPNEKITISDCIDRVKGVATALKFGIAFVKKGHYAFILNTFVETLQEKCIDCCKSGEFWTSCVSPILLKLNKWKLLGIPDDPAWD